MRNLINKITIEAERINFASNSDTLNISNQYVSVGINSSGQAEIRITSELQQLEDEAQDKQLQNMLDELKQF